MPSFSPRSRRYSYSYDTTAPIYTTYTPREHTAAPKTVRFAASTAAPAPAPSAPRARAPPAPPSPRAEPARARPSPPRPQTAPPDLASLEAFAAHTRRCPSACRGYAAHLARGGGICLCDRGHALARRLDADVRTYGDGAEVWARLRQRDGHGDGDVQVRVRLPRELEEARGLLRALERERRERKREEEEHQRERQRAHAMRESHKPRHVGAPPRRDGREERRGDVFLVILEPRDHVPLAYRVR